MATKPILIDELIVLDEDLFKILYCSSDAKIDLPGLPSPPQLPQLPQVPTPAVQQKGSFRTKVRDVFARRNSMSTDSVVLSPSDSERESSKSPGRSFQHRYSYSVRRSESSTPATTFNEIPCVSTEETHAIPEISLTGDPDLPPKWFALLPKHFVSSLIDLLTVHNVLALSQVDHCMNEFLKERENTFFPPERNAHILTPKLTWRHIFVSKYRKNMKSCNIVFCGASQTGTKSTLIRSMASSMARRLAKISGKPNSPPKPPPKKGKGKVKENILLHQHAPEELTDEEKIEQELQKLYSTSFLQSASFYYGLPNGNIVKLICYELGTEEYMIDAAAQQLRNSNAIIFGFDVTSAESFSYFDLLVPKIKQYVQSWCVLLMVANKCDLDINTWCSYGTNEKSELTKYTTKFGIEKVFFASARYGTGVDTFIDYLGSAVGIKREPPWISDHSVDECRQCSIEFRMLKRKHHCRYCGGVFCNECAIEKMEIREMNITKPVRVCKDCKELLEDQQTRRQKPLWALLDLS
eukprot:TRINITY_DN4532_c0_g1_i1.p1 TRINITY_DN4532_c0_g1~~TRINITY_DN4532_c0_g1_i1.p1  ORF type:complete len:523 (+),score=42.45 TRINITY_DN4532_c0_g1_i1:94-1662(+)